MKYLLIAFLSVSLSMTAGGIQTEKEMKEALIIIDVQNDYFEGGANPLIGSKEASENAQKVLQSFRDSSLLVVHYNI